MIGKEVIIWLDRRWYDALNKHLKDETLEEHLEEVIDQLCNQLPRREYERMSYFGTIYADTELPSRARAVYMYLRDRSDAEGKCWPGIKTIASDMKLSRSTVKRALADLEQHGYLKKLPRYRANGSSTSNLYSIQ